MVVDFAFEGILCAWKSYTFDFLLRKLNSLFQLNSQAFKMYQIFFTIFFQESYFPAKKDTKHKLFTFLWILIGILPFLTKPQNDIAIVLPRRILKCIVKQLSYHMIHMGYSDVNWLLLFFPIQILTREYVFFSPSDIKINIKWFGISIFPLFIDAYTVSLHVIYK